MRRRRVALYGGTFDPVHNGHLAVARELQKLFALEDVLLIPAYVAPHKRGARVTPALHRYAMLALATQHEPFARVSTIELDFPARPFTIETIERVQFERGTAWRTFFIMGADSWLEIETWHEWRQLLALTDVIVVARPGYERAAHHCPVSFDRKRVLDVRGCDACGLSVVLEENVSQKAEPSENETREFETRVYFTDAVVLDVAATKIRRLAYDRDESLREFVPPAIAEYIAKYELYKNEH
jgi:nicotinate-nucleotide adenylyltransferase